MKRTDHNKYIGADSMEDITGDDEDEDSDKSRESSSGGDSVPPVPEEAATAVSLKIYNIIPEWMYVVSSKWKKPLFEDPSHTSSV